MTLFDLTGRRALVTGGGSGIGLAIARVLADHGAEVAIWGRRLEVLQAARDQLSLGGRQVDIRVVDVRDEGSVAAGVAGAEPPNIVVVNAGSGGAPGPFVRSTSDQLCDVMATNLGGAYVTMRETTAAMIAHGVRGSVVVISSLAAVEGAGRNQAYAASKAAVLAMANGAAVELAGHGIRVNTILPGWIATEMSEAAQGSAGFTDRVISRVPLGRWGRPDEVAGAAVYLASDAASYQTGSTIVVDGGYSIY